MLNLFLRLPRQTRLLLRSLLRVLPTKRRSKRLRESLRPLESLLMVPKLFLEAILIKLRLRLTLRRLQEKLSHQLPLSAMKIQLVQSSQLRPHQLSQQPKLLQRPPLLHQPRRPLLLQLHQRKMQLQPPPQRHQLLLPPLCRKCLMPKSLLEMI